MASRFQDFPNGLRSATDYLSSQNPINAQLSGSVADIGRFVVSAQMDTTLKEIVCSLLAGRGLKLPNLQICISLNIKELLGGLVGRVQQVLYDALAKLDAAFDKFLNHLNLDKVLGRINNILGEITQIANMINFCSSPLDPVQIPNVLENAMQSFLGAGKSIIDSIGSIIPDEIGGCLIDGQFNAAIWNGGILKKIADNYDSLDDIADTLIADINGVTNAIDELILSESNVKSTYDNGGSDLAESPRSMYTGVGTLFNAQDEGIGGAVRNGGALWSSYQQLASYQVVGRDGTIYNNIFELFVDDDLLRVLRRTPNPVADIIEQQPVYNYCGEVVGYTRVARQESPQTSVGSIPQPITQPGFNAGGLPTNPIIESTTQPVGGVTEVNNIYNVDSNAIIVNNEFELLSQPTSIGKVIYRIDNSTTYVSNGSSSGTLADFYIIGSNELGEFLQTLQDTTGEGIIVRSNADVFYRKLIGVTNQITITNSDGIDDNPTIGLSNSLVLPGTNAVVIPRGTTGERVTLIDGALRYNTTTSQFEGRHAGEWKNFSFGEINSSMTGEITTTNNVATEVLFSGLRRQPTLNKTWFFEITAVASRTLTSDSTAIRVEGVVDNTANTVSIIGGSGNRIAYNGTPGTANYDLLIDIVSGTSLRVRVIGDTGHTVSWKVRYNFIEA